MGLLEFFVAVVIVVAAGVGSAVPMAAWNRMRDPRFLSVAGANLALVGLGAMWAYGALPVAPPEFAVPTWPALLLVAAAALLLLATGLLRRRA